MEVKEEIASLQEQIGTIFIEEKVMAVIGEVMETIRKITDEI